MNATTEPTELEYPPLAARCLKHFEIPDDAIGADTELARRTDECAMELLRLSLLGIAGYGFLLKEMALGNSAGLAACQKYAGCLLAGAGALAITATAALLTREWSVRCSAIQIMILRTYAKLESGGWAPDEENTLRKSLPPYRAEQRKKLTRAKYSCEQPTSVLRLELSSRSYRSVLCFLPSGLSSRFH